MCNRYAPPRPQDVAQRWLPRQAVVSFPAGPVFPRAPGPFIRAARRGPGDEASQAGALELVVGTWGLVPWFAKSASLPYATNNARFEELAAKASYRQPWARGQRCIIPAAWFDEPCWETGRNVWWRFRRADGQAWALAGLWNTWVDPTSGEIVESYTMLTLNADAHPLMSRMHKPDPALPTDRQDKRSVVVLRPQDEAIWLHGSPAEAAAVVGLAPVHDFDAGPVDAPAQRELLGP
jgi:putative SOS response-associated peptidase YedK